MEKMKEQICTTIMSAHTVQEAVQGVHTLARINTEFNNAFINKPLITRDIVGLLVAKFGGYHENIAQLLATKGAKHYRRKQIKFLQQWATIFDPSNDNDLIVYDKFDVVMALILGSGADLGFSNAQGLTPLYAVMMPFIDIETLSEAQRVVYAKSIVRVVRLIMRYGGKHRVLQPQPLNKRSLLSIAVKLSAWTNNTNLVTTLLDVGLSADVLNSDMGYTGTPLHDAVAFRSPALVGLLLGADADITKINSNSLTPLEQARRDLAHELNDITLQKIVQVLESATKNQAAKEG